MADLAVGVACRYSCARRDYFLRALSAYRVLSGPWGIFIWLRSKRFCSGCLNDVCLTGSGPLRGWVGDAGKWHVINSACANSDQQLVSVLTKASRGKANGPILVLFHNSFWVGACFMWFAVYTVTYMIFLWWTLRGREREKERCDTIIINILVVSCAGCTNY